jgi:hypothetical protein
MAVRAARIVDGLVVNVILVEALPAPEIEALAEGELIECPDIVGIDWTYNPAKLPNQWSPPPSDLLKPAPEPDDGV